MSTYIITGATGYIGSALTKALKSKEAGCEIVVLVRNEEKAYEMLPAGVHVLQADLTNWDMLEATVSHVLSKCDYIIHCASVTGSSEMINHPVEVIESIVNTTQNVLKLARLMNVKSMVYLSSMEVYGNIDCLDGHRVSEEEMGEVDVLKTRSCYPLGKRMGENICFSYFKEYGVPVKIARLAQTFGSGVLPGETRVFAQFARAAKEKKDIVLHTDGMSMGNYCGVEDAISGIIVILQKGKNGEAYNVVNEANTMSIRDMAQMVVDKFAGNQIKVVFDIPKDNIYGYAANTGLLLSGEKLEGLGWKPGQSLEDMYRDVIREI